MSASVPGTKPLVAVLDDDAGFRASAGILLSGDFETAPLAAPGELFALLAERAPDILLLDIHLGDGEPDGFAVLERLRAEGHRFPVIVLTILAGLDVTARALRLGVPFLQKDRELDADRFRQQIRLALHAHRLDTELAWRRRLAGESPDEGTFPWPDRGWGAELLRSVQPFLAGAHPLLIEGERGTGKCTLARWVHRNSPGAGGPFVTLSAEGWSEDAVSRELFGFARSDGRYVPGTLDAAAQGTLFVEDLQLLPDPVHHRLIRAVEDGTYTPIGSRRRHRLTCRVIAARAIRSSDPVVDEPFWNAYRIRLAPLRARREDVGFHLDRLRAELSAAGHPVVAIGPEDLEGHPLPGNFYDLKAVLLRGLAALQFDGGAPDPLDSEVWRKLAAWPLRRAYAEMLVRYLREVEKLLGRDIDRWRAHTGYERAQVYRFFKLLDEEG